MTRDNAAIGRKAKELGDAFEEWVNTQHEMAMHLGILAHVEKTQAKTKVIDGRLQYEKKGVADYIGCLERVPLTIPHLSAHYLTEKNPRTLYHPAQYLAVEAKSIGKDYLPRVEITDKQEEHLDAVAHAGGLALLVVEFRPSLAERAARFAVEWLRVPWKVKRTAESVSMIDLEALMCRVHEPCYLSRWHAGGPRSSTSGGAKPRRYARE